MAEPCPHSDDGEHEWEECAVGVILAHKDRFTGECQLCDWLFGHPTDIDACRAELLAHVGSVHG